jgi:hypothetical protein
MTAARSLTTVTRSECAIRRVSRLSSTPGDAAAQIALVTFR